MVLKINQVRSELEAVRNQREAADAVHDDQVRRYHERMASLQSKINTIRRKNVTFHEAKGALDHVYNDGGTAGAGSSSPRSRPLQCIVRREAMLIATLRRIQIIQNATAAIRHAGDGIRLAMIFELTAIEDEKSDLVADYQEWQKDVVKEIAAMTRRHSLYIQHQHSLMDKIDPTRLTSKHTLALESLNPMSKLLNAGLSPMSKLVIGASSMSTLRNVMPSMHYFVKGTTTSDIVQMVSRSA